MSQFWPSTAGGGPPTNQLPRFVSPAPAPAPAPARLPPRRNSDPPPDPEVALNPGRGPSSDARNALLIAALVIVAVVAFAALFTLLVGDDGGEEAAVASVPPTVAPTTPPTAPPSTPPPASTVPPLPPPQTAPELQQFVAEQRGHSFTADVPVVMIPEDDWGDQLLAAIPEDELEQQLWELQTLGILGTGPDALDELKALLAEGLVGLYDNGRVLVRGESRSDEVDLTIVHELAHALDDQTFGFDRPELFETDDEAPFGFEATVEGSAMSVEAAYAASKGIDYVSPADVELTQGLLALPRYVFGEAYVRSLLDAGGNGRLDDAFRTPPTTSKQVMEQIFHLAGYTPVSVEPPPANGEVIDQGLFGQVRFWQMFTQVMPRENAEALASAWTGDWHVVWVDGLDQCLRVDVDTATAESASDFAQALRAWAVSQDNAVVEELSSGLVRLTTCVPRPPPPAGGVSPA